jgi:hypothetical protein
MAMICQFSEQGAIVESLCRRALEGALSLDDFYQEWPCRPEKGSFWGTLYDDLEDAIQHAPGTWFAGKVDLPKWQDSWEYFVICLDLQLLRSSGDLARLLEIRDEVLTAKRMSLVDMESLVTRRLAQSA